MFIKRAIEDPPLIKDKHVFDARIKYGDMLFKQFKEKRDELKKQSAIKKDAKAIESDQAKQNENSIYPSVEVIDSIVENL